MRQAKTILVVQPIHPVIQELLAPDYDVVITHETGLAELKDRIAAAHAVIIRATPFPEAVIAAGSNLEIIARTGVGYDNVDLAAASRHGIPVVNTPGANSLAVAEHTLMFLFALAKKTAAQHRAVVENQFQRRNEAYPFELAGKRLGLVGCGRIGSLVARKASIGLDMEVRAYDPYVVPDAVRAAGAEPWPSLTELLSWADFVSIHCSLTAETRQMIGAEEIARMQPSAYLLNLARGEVVDEEALAAALAARTITGAALDVFAEEPPRPDHLLFRQNVLLSPHVAGMSEEAVERIAREVVDKVRTALAGQRPADVLNEEAYA